MKKTKKSWSFGDKLIAALLTLCVAGAGVLAFLILRETGERREAGEGFTALEAQYLYNGVDATPAPTAAPSLAPEEEALGDDGELMAIIAQQEAESQRAGATPTPRPTPAPTKPPAPSPAPQTSATAAPTATPYIPVGDAVLEKVHYSADFGSLLALNEEVVGWLVQDETELNYPVMQAEDNEYYLTHLYTRGINRNGSIFLDCGNAPYFTDMVNYLYGHNRKDGAMFASLPEYQNQAYYEAHPTATLLTPYRDYRLDIFACVRLSLETKDEWHEKTFEGKKDFEAYIARVQKENKLKTDVTPRWGDQLLALCTCTNEVHEDRYIVLARMRPIVYAFEESLSVTKMELDAKETVSGLVAVPGRGQMQYYAQNDPLWAEMAYEGRSNPRGRRLGSGGCAPVSMAMVVANLADENNLWWLSYDSGLDNGLTFCTCSVNQYYCSHRHAQYKPETPKEFRRYLPVLIASFATGNNQWKEVSRGKNPGTKPLFMKRVAEVYNLRFEVSKQQERALAVLERGGMAVAVTGGAESPFTGNGHFLVLAAVDDLFLYILDPYLKEDYSQTDPKGLIEQLQPGLLRVKRRDWAELCLYTYYLFEKNE